jgi:hypothetical protein
VSSNKGKKKNTEEGQTTNKRTNTVTDLLRVNEEEDTATHKRGLEK